MRAVVLVVVGLALGACRGKDAPDVATSAPEPDTAVVAEIAAPEASLPEPAPAPPSPPKEKDEWWRDAVGYEIFVRSFQDTNGDGIGDFKGVTERLDHLTTLGVDLVWLMPIHPSPSYHGYDVTDYYAVNPQYGKLENFDELVAEAKARGIRLVMDLLLNHSSDRHPWFLAARKGPTNPKYPWYVWRESRPGDDEGWARPWDGAALWHEITRRPGEAGLPAGEIAEAEGSRWYYALFWGGMPDLNLANPDVQREMDTVMGFWVERGIAGFRVDAIRYLIEAQGAQTADTAETHAYLKGLRKRFDEAHPGALLLGEAWTSADDQAGYYGDGDELHMAFSFDMAAAIVETAGDGVRSRLNQMLDRSAELFAKDRGFEAPFLTNHDMARVARQLMKDPARLRLAAALMLASPGTPFIYYGEEIAMVGGAAKEDENKRTPMRWTKQGPHHGFTTGTPWWPMTDEAEGVDVESHAADPGSLMSLYATLVRARKAHVALRRGDQQRLDVKGGRGVVAFTRTAPTGERALVVVNADGQAVPSFVVPVAGAPKVVVAEGLDGAPTTDGKALTMPGMGPRSFVWITLE